jgi:pyridoxine/pyridoxamine 5'-phosphate oxidase
MEIKRSGSQLSNKGPAENFTAQSALTCYSRRPNPHVFVAQASRLSRALSPNAEALTHCAAIALCRARKTYF